jgi:hypothetical protein
MTEQDKFDKDRRHLKLIASGEIQYMIIVGTPVNGFKYYGPFPKMIDARNWVVMAQDKSNLDMKYYWVDEISRVPEP